MLKEKGIMSFKNIFFNRRQNNINYKNIFHLHNLYYFYSVDNKCPGSKNTLFFNTGCKQK